MLLTHAAGDDFPQLCRLYQQVSQKMREEGCHQWLWGNYPNEELVRHDLDRQVLYVVRREEEILCAVAVDTEFEDAYAGVNWLYGVRPGTFHRLAISPDAQGQGLGRRVVAEVIDLLREMGCDSLRCDTFIDNARALHLYQSMGMRRSGEVYYPGEGDGKSYPTLEMPLTADCPLLPLKMHPAWRCGALTPWGGTKLQEQYGKDFPEVPAGESLEVSCIPGLSSTDDTGVPLKELVASCGADFAGKYAGKPFPLLLKLIDAAQSLSVQVHPDDGYAYQQEDGKQGKTEAWLILDAPEGAELVYGLVPGVTKQQLEDACHQGAAVEKLLRRVKVRAGDVCYIPAGCVHAISPGITLYEIQQSSDVTYRFYDWNRVDAQGNRRELHLDKALDVSDLSFAAEPVHAPDAPCARVLETPFFTLDVLAGPERVQLPPVKDFALLTVLSGEGVLSWQGGSLTLPMGATVYLPAKCPEVWLSGHGQAALARP